MAVGGKGKPGGGWVSSLEAVARESQGTEIDQGRLTATYVGSIFAERRRRREEETGGGEKNGRRELPRFFMPPPASAASGTGPPLPAGSSGSNADTTQTLEESRVAATRSKLRAKARSRFLQRREEHLMGFEDLSDVERALATCVAPAPPPPPSPPPPPAVVDDGDNVSNGAKAAALEPGVAAPNRGGGSDDHQAGAAAAAEAGPAGGNGTAGVSGSDGDASQGGLTADTTSSPPPPGGDPHAAVDAQGGSADYMDFVRLRGLVSKKAAAACFRSKTFLRFPRDIRARIPSRVFFKHVYESVTLQKTRLTLHFYDSEGLGFLREQDLENYVYDHIPTMPALRAIHDNFYPFYVFTAVRRFMFFLDPKRTGKISIDTLVRSRVMEEFLQVRIAPGAQGEPGSAAAAAGAASENGGTQNEDAGAKGGGEGTADSSEGGGGSSTAAVGGVGTTPSTEGAPQGEGGRDDGNNHSPLQDLSKNWFSAESTLRVYGEYLELDEDQNGMLSKQELVNFAATPSCSIACPVPRTSAAAVASRSGSGLLPLSPTNGGVRTPSPTRPVSPGIGGAPTTAVGSSSPLCSSSSPGVTSGGGGGGGGGKASPAGGGAGAAAGAGGRAAGEAQMDYKTFLDLVLAMDNKQTRQAMQYFWRVLDVQGKGRLTISTIHLFFRDIAHALEEGGFETPTTDDVKDEIFDMVKPADPTFISLADLLASGAGHTVVSMLVDTNGFWTYDNRESLAT
ncbi:unnamed protein product [Ectocarpus sp. 6 AP-2014]